MREDIQKEIEKQREEYDKDTQDLIDLVNGNPSIHNKKEYPEDAFEKAMDILNHPEHEI